MPSLPDKILTLFATFHIRREKALADMEALYAPDVRFVDPMHDVTGVAKFLSVNRAWLHRVKEMRFEDLEIVGEEPHFMLRWNCVIEPKIGPAIVAPGVTEIRTQNGLVVEHRDHWDLLSAFAESFPVTRTLYKQILARVFTGVKP